MCKLFNCTSNWKVWLKLRVGNSTAKRLVQAHPQLGERALTRLLCPLPDALTPGPCWPWSNHPSRAVSFWREQNRLAFEMRTHPAHPQKHPPCPPPPSPARTPATGPGPYSSGQPLPQGLRPACRACPACLALPAKTQHRPSLCLLGWAQYLPTWPFPWELWVNKLFSMAIVSRSASLTIP